jgi:hypothetical protein
MNFTIIYLRPTTLVHGDIAISIISYVDTNLYFGYLRLLPKIQRADKQR